MPPLPEDRLQLVPCDPGAPFLARALLPALQHAVQRQRGLLLLHLPHDVVERTGLTTLRERYSRASSAAGNLGSDAHVVHSSAAPEAGTALHTLASELTKAHMLRMGRRSTALEPFLDDLEDWLQPREGSAGRVHSRVRVSTANWLDSHMDRGLFNIVVGRHVDIGTIELNLPDRDVDVWKLLPPSEEIEEDELLALVIPGYTLQCIDPSVPAPLHSVPRRQETEGRATVVLQWQLHPQYRIGEATVGELMAQFESVRDAAYEERASRLRRERDEYLERCVPAMPAAPGFWVHLRTLTGRTDHVAAHPEWTILNLKWGLQQVSGIPTDQASIIFQGRCPGDEETLVGCGITNGCTASMVLKLRGD